MTIIDIRPFPLSAVLTTVLCIGLSVWSASSAIAGVPHSNITHAQADTPVCEGDLMVKPVNRHSRLVIGVVTADTAPCS